MRISLGILTAVTVIASLPAWAADPLPRATPESVGMSSAALERIGATLKADVAKGRLPGAVLAIARKGKLIHFEAVGFRDKATGTPMTTDSIFSIASMTKPLVAVAILQLVEEGKLSLTDPVERFLPALGHRQVAVLKTEGGASAIAGTVPAARSITIQDLLRHTSGITYGGRGATAVHKLYPASSSSVGMTMTADEFIATLGAIPLLYQPGTVWDYGLSFDVLGVVVERVSGMPLDKYLQQHIFHPLGMVDSGFLIPPDKVARFARGFPNDPDTGKPQFILDTTQPLKLACGGGCAESTASDYLRFAQTLLNKGRFDGTRILGRKAVELLTSDHLGHEIKYSGQADPSRAGYGFGLGMAVRTEAGENPLLGSVGDFTWAGAYGTNFWVDPKEELTVVFMAATPGPTRVYYRRVINALVYQAIAD